MPCRPAFGGASMPDASWLVSPVLKHLLGIVWRKRLGGFAAETAMYPQAAEQRWDLLSLCR
jgi:hypothetical protein